jgi:hypothetical protein
MNFLPVLVPYKYRRMLKTYVARKLFVQTIAVAQTALKTAKSLPMDVAVTTSLFSV